VLYCVSYCIVDLCTDIPVLITFYANVLKALPLFKKQSIRFAYLPIYLIRPLSIAWIAQRQMAGSCISNAKCVDLKSDSGPFKVHLLFFILISLLRVTKDYSSPGRRSIWGQSEIISGVVCVFH
jgi:hypothetical protein